MPAQQIESRADSALVRFIRQRFYSVSANTALLFADGRSFVADLDLTLNVR